MTAHAAEFFTLDEVNRLFCCRAHAYRINAQRCIKQNNKITSGILK